MGRFGTNTLCLSTINDTDDFVNCKILKLADDTKIIGATYSEVDIITL